MSETSPAEAIFFAALQRPPGERAAFLGQACGGDAELRGRIERMLAVQSYLGGFLDQPEETATCGQPAAPAGPPTEAPGAVLAGRYKLLQRIGEGGMGVVWVADQTEPVRRRVALKVIRPGLGSAALLARFEQERQALALMDHPHIAKVLDGGATASGQPYFVMELVKGQPITHYCDESRLSLRQRLGLFLGVCQAVQHAHQKGIIHRDIKPGNVLVGLYDGAAVPKVIDFGVAKATGQRLTDKTLFTEFGAVVGTLEYMSPEQAELNQLDIDTRSDVYSLGVLLYELLTGTTPVERKRLKEAGLLEALRLIREEEAARPSVRLSATEEAPAIAANRGVEPRRLSGLVRGELDWIVMKCLEKDRNRRYETANALARDLQRYLADEPVLACPPSAGYRLRKHARRHRALVGGVLATGVALILGVVGTILFAVAEARQRGQAEHNALAADAEKQKALYQAYRACLAAASAALENHDVAEVVRHLRSAPEDLRGWEWHHLYNRLDDSSSEVPLPAGGGFLIPAPDRLRVGVLTSAGLRITDLDGGEHGTVPIGTERRRHVSLTQTSRGLRVAAWVGTSAFDLLDDAGKVLCRVNTGNDEPAPVVVSPDGTRLCVHSGGDRREVVVFDAASGKQTALCKGHGDAVLTYTFSPDSARLVSGSVDRTARVWDAATGALLATCQGHLSSVHSAAFRPDGSRLVTASPDGTVRQWDARTGQAVEPPYDRHSAQLHSAVYSPDGQWVASAGDDRTVRVWRARGRHNVAILYGHTGTVTAVAFAPGGYRLASLSSEAAYWRGDGTVRVWDVDPRATLPVLRGHTSYVYPVAYSPDGSWVASGGWDRQVRLWDAATGEPCATLPHPGFVRCLAYSPEGAWLVSAADGDDLRVWDTATARLRKRIPVPAGPLEALVVRPDGRRLAVRAVNRQGHGDGLGVCDVASGKWLYKDEGGALAYSPDGRWLAALGADLKSVLLLDAETHRTVARLDGHEKNIHSASFSPDSRLLATCGLDRTVRLWPVEGGACRVLRGHTDEVFAVAFHPGGKRLATAGRDRAVWLWDVARGEVVARLPGHANYVWSLGFSPDGKTLASGSGDATVRLWDTEPLRERYRTRREVEAARPEATRLVGRLLAEQGKPDRVASRLRSDASLGDPLRRAALREVMRQGNK
jgi:WD40 repeat protein